MSVIPKRKNNCMQLVSIQCLSTSESGHDEVYLVCQSDGGLPRRTPGIPNYTSMGSGDVWTLDNLLLYFDYEVLVTLWDQDVAYDPNVATYLQSCDFMQGGGGPWDLKLTNHNGAQYIIKYQFIQQ